MNLPILRFPLNTIALALGWLLDKLLGDPPTWPHPIVGFGRMIAWGEKRLNQGKHRVLKGGLLVFVLTTTLFMLSLLLQYALFTLSPYAVLGYHILLLFFCLSGTTLIREVRMVFEAVDRSLAEGRKQVARIVGRETDHLTAQEVRTAALETLAENLSDGVVAPLFWYGVLGVPGILTYKLINTMDSMIGYKTARYQQFGRVAARLDDFVNYLPARLTALLMVMVSGRPSLIRFVRRYGRQHASPNAGYPEAALAGILSCQFGGTHHYFNEVIEKPVIGSVDRLLTTQDMQSAIKINQRVEWATMAILMVISYFVPDLSLGI